jgi:hypothetical protein
MKNIEDEFEMQSRIINKVWDEDEPEALSQHDVSGRSEQLLRDCSTCGTFDICDCHNCLDFDRWRPKQ